MLVTLTRKRLYDVNPGESIRHMGRWVKVLGWAYEVDSLPCVRVHLDDGDVVMDDPDFELMVKGVER